MTKKIYFNLRPHSRERMWDTTRYANEVCEVLLPNIIQKASIDVYKKLKKSNKLISKLKIKISRHLINKQTIDYSIAKKADLVYLWGAFPKFTSKDFIIELDNPYVLAYYHSDNFKHKKHLIRQQLDKAYKISYLSITAKNHTLALLGDKYEQKSFVNYPYMSDNYKKNNRIEDVINFIFVGLETRLKGGYELLAAFFKTKDSHIRLTFISNVSTDIKNRYQNDSRIKILPPQSRENLINKIYPKMDVMIFPSFYESFGVVLLEALSFGMGIITVNIYSTPEVVTDNYNGKLLAHPILQTAIINNQTIVDHLNLRINDFRNQYLAHNEFYYDLYNELKLSIKDAISNYKNWQANSLTLFNQKFSPEVWLANFKKIIN